MWNYNVNLSICEGFEHLKELKNQTRKCFLALTQYIFSQPDLWIESLDQETPLHFCVILSQSSMHWCKVSSKDLRKAENTLNLEPFLHSSNTVQGILHKRKEHTKSLSLNPFCLWARRSKAASNVNRQWGGGACSFLSIESEKKVADICQNTQAMSGSDNVSCFTHF